MLDEARRNERCVERCRAVCPVERWWTEWTGWSVERCGLTGDCPGVVAGVAVG